MGRRKTHEEFVLKAYTILGDRYRVISNYVNSVTPISIEHDCGKVFTAIPNNLINRGASCPKCFHHSKKRINNQRDRFFNAFKKAAGSEYKLLSDYLGQTKGITVKHIPCGNVYETTPKYFINDGNRCLKCSYVKRGVNKRISVEEIKNRIMKKYGRKIELLSGYETTESKCIFRCNTCSFEFQTTPYILLMDSVKHGCINCAKRISSGEERIINYLKERNISFETEFSFDDLVYKNKLRFDVAIINPNTSNKPILIEYDGEQHFHPVSIYGGDVGFYETKKRDSIKDKYCTDNKLRLIRIPYWEYDNIENILAEEVSGF